MISKQKQMMIDYMLKITKKPTNLEIINKFESFITQHIPKDKTLFTYTDTQYCILSIHIYHKHLTELINNIPNNKIEKFLFENT